MKNEKGITVTSLIIYVIAMALVIVLISRLTTYFYKNVDLSNLQENPTNEFSKFSNTITKETNIPGNKVVAVKREYGENRENYIIFSDGNQYTFKATNGSIYKNKTKLCSNVNECFFSYKFIDSQYQITISFVSGSIDKELNFNIKQY